MLTKRPGSCQRLAASGRPDATSEKPQEACGISVVGLTSLLADRSGGHQSSEGKLRSDRKSQHIGYAIYQEFDKYQLGEWTLVKTPTRSPSE